MLIILNMFSLAWTYNIPALQMVFVWLFLAKEIQCWIFLQLYLTVWKEKQFRAAMTDKLSGPRWPGGLCNDSFHKTTTDSEQKSFSLMCCINFSFQLAFFKFCGMAPYQLTLFVTAQWDSSKVLSVIHDGLDTPEMKLYYHGITDGKFLM